MAAETWQLDYNAATMLAQEIMELINERNAAKRTGSNSVKVQTGIRVKLSEFSNTIRILRTQLARPSSNLTPRELERRQQQVDSLISKEKELNTAFKPTVGFSDNSRDGLLNPGYENPYSATHTTDGDMTSNQYMQQHQQIMEEQDKGLDALVEVIRRQKMMGTNIGEELDYHNELIDEIHDEVDATNSKLLATEGHVKKVTKKAGSCALIVIVILLLIAILVVAVVPT